MKKLKVSAAQRTVRRRTLAFCVAVSFTLATAAASLCQGKDTNIRPDGAEKVAMQQMRNIAEATAVLLNVYMDARATEMLAFSATCERLKEALANAETRADANRVLTEWLTISGAYDAVLLLDRSGVCVAASPEGLVNRDFSGETAFKGAVEGKLTIIDFHKSDVVGSLDPKSKGWTLAIAAPIIAGNDVVGVLVSFLNWSRVVKLIAGIRIGDTGYVYVLDRENRVIVHPLKEFYGERLAGPKINLLVLDEAVKKKVPYCSYEFTNPFVNKADTKFVGFAYPAGYGNFPGLGWTVGAGVDRSEALYANSILLGLLRSLGLVKE